MPAVLGDCVCVNLGGAGGAGARTQASHVPGWCFRPGWASSCLERLFWERRKCCGLGGRPSTCSPSMSELRTRRHPSGRVWPRAAPGGFAPPGSRDQARRGGLLWQTLLVHAEFSAVPQIQPSCGCTCPHLPPWWAGGCGPRRLPGSLSRPGVGLGPSQQGKAPSSPCSSSSISVRRSSGISSALTDVA